MVGTPTTMMMMIFRMTLTMSPTLSISAKNSPKTSAVPRLVRAPSQRSSKPKTTTSSKR